MNSTILNTQMTRVAKSTYDTPVTEVVELQPEAILLNGSPTEITSTRSAYGTANEQEWE